MILEDLEREILKVAGQGGIARVPEETVLESMEADDEDERPRGNGSLDGRHVRGIPPQT